MSFFLVGHFDFFFQKKQHILCFPMKTTLVFMPGIIFLKKWFPAKNHSHQTFQPAVYTIRRCQLDDCTLDLAISTGSLLFCKYLHT